MISSPSDFTPFATFADATAEGYVNDQQLGGNELANPRNHLVFLILRWKKSEFEARKDRQLKCFQLTEEGEKNRLQGLNHRRRYEFL